MYKTIDIGINGAAGRIGKLNANEFFILHDEDVNTSDENRVIVRAINDLASIDEIVESYQKKDQTHGYLGWRVEKLDDTTLSINGNKVAVFGERDPAKIPWKDYGVKVVSECSGAFKDRQGVEGHLKAGAERVVISAPIDNVDGTFAMAVNHEKFDLEKHYIISNASCTTKALAVPLKSLMDYGIEIHGVLMDTAHAATNTQRALQFGSEYGVLNEIQTAKTGAASATAKLIPLLEGKMDGYALRVPTSDGSFANIFFNAEGYLLDSEKINRILEAASKNPKTLGRLEYFIDKEASSTDIIGRTASSIIIASKTRAKLLPFYSPTGKPLALCGLCSGYDNERGPARDQAMLVRYIAQRL